MYEIIVAVDVTTDTGSRCVTTKRRVGERSEERRELLDVLR